MRRCFAHAPWMAMALLVLVPFSEGGAFGQGFPGRQGGRLARAGLEVGSTLPALSVYDTTGTNVALSSLLAGHYTVLVTGCLDAAVVTGASMFSPGRVSNRSGSSSADPHSSGSNCPSTVISAVVDGTSKSRASRSSSSANCRAASAPERGS